MFSFNLTRLKYKARACISSILEMPLSTDWPAVSGSSTSSEPGRAHEEQACQARQPRPGDQARREAGEHVLQQDRLRELPEGEHEGPYPRVVLDLRSKSGKCKKKNKKKTTDRSDLKAQVGMLVHLGEEVRV